MTVKHRGLLLSVAAGVISLAAAGASGQIIQLDDLNSTAQFDIGSQAGQFTWLVDGIDHMYQQWFWYRAGGDQAQHSIDTLVPIGNQVTDTNHFTDPRLDTLDALWRDGLGRFDLELNATLRGATPGSNRSDITEQIRITNNTATALPFTFFQYVDLDLNNTIPDTSVQIINGERAEQVDAPFTVSEAILTPLPSRYEVNFYPNTLAALNGGLYNLNNNAGPLGPGDLTWAFQWDLLIGPGQSVLISKDKSIVPTPGSATLLALGGLALARRRRR